MDHAQPQQTELKQYADRLEHLCRAQADEITRLRDELTRATEGASAYVTLSDIHRNRDLPAAVRTKAAIGCLSREMAPLAPEKAPLDLSAEPAPLPLAEVIRLQRARADQALLTDPQFEAWRNRRHLLGPGVSDGDNGDDHS